MFIHISVVIERNQRFLNEPLLTQKLIMKYLFHLGQFKGFLRGCSPQNNIYRYRQKGDIPQAPEAVRQ